MTNNNSKIKKYGIPVVALCGAVSLGAAFGPALASADDEVENATDSETTESSDSKKGKKSGMRKAQRAETLEALGLTQEVLQEGREADKSLAEIASEQGISQEDLVAAIVGSIVDRAEEAEKELKHTEEEITEKVTEKVATSPSERPEKTEGHNKRGKRLGNLIDEDKEAFKAALESDDQEAAKAILEKSIDNAVAEGKITEEQAAEKKATLAEKDLTEKKDRNGHRGQKGEKTETSA